MKWIDSPKVNVHTSGSSATGMTAAVSGCKGNAAPGHAAMYYESQALVPTGRQMWEGSEMLTLIEARRTRRLTDYGGPRPKTGTLGTTAHRDRSSLRAFAGVCRRRRQKVLCIRRQLTADSYNIESRLDAVLEKVLQDLAN